MDSIYENLNDKQLEAVRFTDGPLLVLAGAGSGKTRVLTHRIAYLISEKKVPPYQIMAITFTNKAAGEMRERVDRIVGTDSSRVWVSTFHSACVRILRRHIDRLGYGNDFAIYDTDDQKRLLKDVIKRLNLDPKSHRESSVLSKISDFKNKLIGVDEAAKMAESDFKQKEIYDIYRDYQNALKKNNALDFDDLIMETVELFKKCPDVLEDYQEHLRYILVDEYQDTNAAQFTFVRMLADKYKNLCVVGDDDQSIYKFRGADITNILQFEKYFPNAKVVRLEQNYRSTGTILKAANSVISHNQGRKEKTLWCDREDGEKIVLYEAQDGYEEADMVASSIYDKVKNGSASYRDFAILYRTNAQSRALEEKLITRNIPYKIVGGQNFYQRKEIKDALSYLRIIESSKDDLAVERVINVPKRGIGTTTLSRAKEYAMACNMDLYDVLKMADRIPELARCETKIGQFIDIIDSLREEKEDDSIKELLEAVLSNTGYTESLVKEDTDESRARLENLDELISKVVEYEEHSDSPTLSEFLEEVALVADIDNVDMNEGYVVLMTVHSAKGLEFPNVFLCGMEDGLFPGYMSIVSDDPGEMEEERRLCYVAITRAMNTLCISYAKRRMLKGETQTRTMSRFVKEIPPLILDEKGKISGSTYFELNGHGGYISGSSGITGDGTYEGRRHFAADRHRGAYKTMAARPAYDKPTKQPDFGKKFTVEKADIDYGVGDRVRHVKFGEGIVVSVKDGPRDYQVTVQFDDAGQKIMMASFAKLQKI